MTSDRIYEEAAAWLAREQGGGMDWDRFSDWLDGDPRHRAAYDALALIDRDMDENAGRLSRAMVDGALHPVSPRRVRWTRWAGYGGGAIAAGLGAVLWLHHPGNHEIAVRDYRTRAAQTVRIALGDGGSILLAPASHVRIRGPQIDLDGSAFLDVPHRPGRSLGISVGEFRVSDVGTRFAVENEPAALSVEVAEGSVALSSDSLQRPLTLSAGESLVADRSHGTVRLAAVDPQQVGSWRTGKLQFNNAPLVLVAQEISRYSDERVTVAPELANQPFSGVIAINHGEAPAQTLAQILSLQVKVVDGSLRLQPRRK